MKPGDLVNFNAPIRFFDDTSATCWLTGPALVLETNEYDVTCLSNGFVLYASWQEIGQEHESVQYVT